MKPLSASHIDKWKQCQRREAFIYRLGIREPSSRPAAAGQAVHGVLEGATPDLTDLDSYDICGMAAKLAAASPQLLKQEYEFAQDIDGIGFTGRIDGAYEPGILDFKTTSRKKYVKTVRQLSKDVQRLLYIQVEPTASETLWLYGIWEDMSVEPVRVDIDRKKDYEKFRLHVYAPAEEILACAEDVDPLSLPAASDDGRTGACALFPPHGCPFKSKCFPPNNEMSVAMTSLMNELEQDAQPTPEPAPASVASTKPIGVLYIDCYPIQLASDVTSANVLIGNAAAQVAADQQVHHALLVDYGKGGPMIAAQLAHNLKGQYYGHVTMETRSAEGKACVFKMTELAETVVKAMI